MSKSIEEERREHDRLYTECERLKAEVERLKGNLSADALSHEAEVNAVRKRANLQAGELRSVLADAVRGHCPICRVGGDGSKQNHHEDCEARKLITESRNDVCLVIHTGAPCSFKKGHLGPHSWEGENRRVGECRCPDDPDVVHLKCPKHGIHG